MHTVYYTLRYINMVIKLKGLWSETESGYKLQLNFQKLVRCAEKLKCIHCEWPKVFNLFTARRSLLLHTSKKPLQIVFLTDARPLIEQVFEEEHPPFPLENKVGYIAVKTIKGIMKNTYLHICTQLRTLILILAKSVRCTRSSLHPQIRRHGPDP